MEELTGFVEKLTYYDEESHFAVATLKCQKFPRPIIIVGTLSAIQIGETVECTGKWKQHHKHGMQFEVDSFRLHLPTDAASIEKFLGSGAVKGVGPTYAAKIVGAFGDKTLEILDKHPEKLYDIDGLGEKRVNKLVTAWHEHKSFQELFLFLHTYGISRTYAKKILKKWGNHALQKLKSNPWLLAKEIRGIGFRLADEIATNMGLTKESLERIDAGIDFVLYELSQEGHTCFPLQGFVERAHTLLGVSQELITKEVEKDAKEGHLEIRQADIPMIWSKILFSCEIGIAQEVGRLRYYKTHLRQVDTQKAITWAENTLSIEFAPLQKEAISQSLSDKLTIITGGPGTGKSTITRAIVTIFSKLTRKILLAAPTGRAAKRLSEITRMHASTIHRILKFDFTKGKFKYDRDLPLDCDLMIIDEASMIDTYLMFQLLRAIPNHARIIIIGDANQLPSVGPGNILRDFIASRAIPTTQLTTIFRQAQGSQIIVNAHRINAGMMPFTKSQRKSDFFFIEAKEPDEVKKLIVDLVVTRVPKEFRYDSKKEIQVLAPMRKGACGIEVLNHTLQQALTPQREGTRHFFFRIGDKVMQLKNNYSKDVFNGDIGYITAIDYSEEKIIVDIEERKIEYDFSELDEICLAYAVSIHKFQGCECPCIIMPVHTTHFKLLTRNLLYTGLTRGRKLVIFVGTKQALAIGVQNHEVDKRYTGLKTILQDDSVMKKIPIEQDLFSHCP